jgi:type I restriction enzyme S subunit
MFDGGEPLKPFPDLGRSLPNGWRRARLDDVTHRASGHTPDQGKADYWNGGVDWVSLADSAKLDQGYIEVTDKQISHLGLRYSSAVLLPPETVILSRDAGVGKAAVLKAEMAVSQHFIAWSCSTKNVLDPWFLYAWMQTQKPFFERMAVGSAIKTIGLPIFKRLTIDFPPFAEQRKIAEILQFWDEALEKLAAFRAAKQDRLAGLTQQIMGRGGVFPQRWPLEALSAISTPVRRKNAGNNHPVMTISARSGFLMQSDKFARDMAGRSVDRYTLLHDGEFAYNKGNSKTAAYGCVFRLDRPTALVPFVYYCFSLKKGLDPKFYEHLFATGALNYQLSRLINSGVRNDGLLNLHSQDFYSCRVPVPPLDEQRQIAQALTAAKRELSLLDDEIKALTRQKRGLMQKLLTGEWRVNSEKVLP